MSTAPAGWTQSAWDRQEADYARIFGTPAPANGTTTTPTTPTNSGYTSYVATPGTTKTSTYGTPSRNTTAESQTLQEEQGFSTIASNTGLVSSATLSSIAADQSIVAFYINAMTYGGYTLGDVLNDMKRRELAANGNLDAANLKIIDPEQTRQTYMASAEGQQTTATTAKIIPTFNFQGLTNPEILKYGANMPDDLFKILVPISDPNSQEFKDAVADVKAKYYDIASSQLQAETEQEKAVADGNMEEFKKQLNEKYGVALSNNADKAWQQINSLEDTFKTRGISGSGMETQAIDQELQSIRKNDQQSRIAKLNDQEQKDQTFYMGSASSAQIAALTPEQRAKYGLTPSADILNEYSIQSLQQRFPDWSPEEVNAYHNSIIDENGNFRSTLYKNYYSSLATTATNNETRARAQVQQTALDKENKEYAPFDYTQPLNPQLPVGGVTQPVGNTNTTDTSKSDPGLAAAGTAAKALSDNAAMIKSGNFTFANGTTASAGSNPYTGTGTTSTPKTPVTPTPAPAPATPTPVTQPSTSVADSNKQYLINAYKADLAAGRSTNLSTYGLTANDVK